MIEQEPRKRNPPRPRRRSEWTDHVVLGNAPHVNVIEKSEIFAGPRQLVRITVTREKRKMFYWMECNIIRDSDDKPTQHCLSASNMVQAKEESIDIVRILLHHVLSDI